MNTMDSKAQISIEYLLAAMFGITIAIAAAVLIEAVRSITLKTQARILEIRERTISSLVG